MREGAYNLQTIKNFELKRAVGEKGEGERKGKENGGKLIDSNRRVKGN